MTTATLSDLDVQVCTSMTGWLWHTDGAHQVHAAIMDHVMGVTPLVYASLPTPTPLSWTTELDLGDLRRRLDAEDAAADAAYYEEQREAHTLGLVAVPVGAEPAATAVLPVREPRQQGRLRRGWPGR